MINSVSAIWHTNLLQTCWNVFILILTKSNTWFITWSTQTLHFINEEIIGFRTSATARSIFFENKIRTGSDTFHPTSFNINQFVSWVSAKIIANLFRAIFQTELFSCSADIMCGRTSWSAFHQSNAINVGVLVIVGARIGNTFIILKRSSNLTHDIRNIFTRRTTILFITNRRNNS